MRVARPEGDFSGAEALPALLPANEINALILRDSTYPGAEFLIAAHLPYIAETSEQGLLRDIFGIVSVAERTVADCEDAPGIRLDQAGIRRAVPFAAGRHQFVFLITVQRKLPIAAST